MKSLKKGDGSGVGSGSGSISQRCGSGDPDPHQNVTDPQHWLQNTLASVPLPAFINTHTEPDYDSLKSQFLWQFPSNFNEKTTWDDKTYLFAPVFCSILWQSWSLSRPERSVLRCWDARPAARNKVINSTNNGLVQLSNHSFNWASDGLNPGRWNKWKETLVQRVPYR